MNEYEEVVVKLDVNIIRSLKEYGEIRGWTLEEIIRYIIGNEAAFMGNKPQRIAFNPAPPLFSIPQEPSNIEKMTARMFSSSGMAKCKGCLKQLDSDEIFKGECSTCGEKV